MSAARCPQSFPAYRVKRNLNRDTPLPPEEPGGTNPPDGAIINYWLGQAAKGPVTLEIFDDKGKLVRRYSSEDQPAKVNEDTLTIPSYWLRPPQMLSGQAGSHRFVWDLRSPPTGKGKGGGYTIAAIYKNTPGPQGPMVLPGQHKVKLTVDGQSQVQPLTVKMDPRVRTAPAGLQKQLELSVQCLEGLRQVEEALVEVAELRARLRKHAAGTGGELAGTIAALDKKAAALRLAETGAGLAALLGQLQRSDAASGVQAAEACTEALQTLGKVLGQWRRLKDTAIKAMHVQLRR